MTNNKQRVDSQDKQLGEPNSQWAILASDVLPKKDVLTITKTATIIWKVLISTLGCVTPHYFLDEVC